MEASLKKHKGLITKKRKDMLFYICLVAIPFVHYLIFYIAVNFNSVLMAFQNLDLSGKGSWAGFDNFSKVITNLSAEKKLVSSVGNSLLAYGTSLFVGVPLALLFSYYIAKKFAGYKVFSIFLFLPTVIPSFSLTLMFRRIVDSSLPYLLRDLGITMNGLMNNSDTAFGTILFYSVWVSFGANILLYVGAMRGISESVIEAAALDGAIGFREFVHISLPLIYPTAVTFIVVGVAGIFTNQLNLFNFYGKGASENMYTFGYYMYAEMLKVQGTLTEYPYFAAMGILMSLVATPLTFGVKYLLEKLGPNVG